MGLFDHFPYTNFHELNLDWIMEELLTLENTIEQFVSINALKYADPIQWNITSQYEKNTIVIDPLTGTAYISVQPVPSGVALTRTECWTVVFDLGSFVVRAAKNFTDKFEEDTTLTATFPSAVNDWLIWGDTLYRVISNIVAGDQYVIDSNIEHFTIEDIIGHLEDLTTADKSNIVAAINEVMTIIGSLTDLTTVDNSDIVAAINELVTNISDIQNLIGNDPLTTTASTLTGAVNELDADIDLLSYYVTPQMFGAAGDGVTDDAQAFNDALASGKSVIVPVGTYRIASMIQLPYQANIKGADEFKTILKFDANVNGIQINHSNNVSNLTISVDGNVGGIYMYIPDNYSYDLKTKVKNIIITQRNLSVQGSGIMLIAEKQAIGVEGAYNLTFDNVNIQKRFKYGIELLARVKTTNQSECWFTDILFKDMFIDGAETPIYSDWEDISGDNSVPHTGDASSFGHIVFQNVSAQYVAGITQEFAYITNIFGCIFTDCKTFDFHHVVSDLNRPVYTFNANTNICRVVLDNYDILNVSTWIAFINSDASTYNEDFMKVIPFLRSGQVFYPDVQPGKKNIYGNFIHDLTVLQGTDALLPQSDNPNVDIDQYCLGVIIGNMAYYSCELHFTGAPDLSKPIAQLKTGSSCLSYIPVMAMSGNTPLRLDIRSAGMIYIPSDTPVIDFTAGRLRFNVFVPLRYRLYN